MFEVLQITVPEQTAFQYYAAIVILLFLGLAILYLLHSSVYHRLDDENRSVKSQVITQLHRQTPSSVRIPSGEQADDYRLAIRGTMLGSSPERETIWTGARKVGSEVKSYWTPIVLKLPRPVLKAWTTAFLVAVFGAIAVSTSAVVELLTSRATYPSLEELMRDTRFYTVELYETSRDLIFEFPFLVELWNFAFAYTILFLDWLYQNWPILAATLVFLGALVFMFERSKIDEPGRILDASLFGVRPISYVILVWLSGVVPSVVIRNLGFPDLAPVIGFLFAFAMTIGLVVTTTRRWWRAFDEFPREDYAYFTAKSLSTLAVSVGWVMVSVYIINAAINGQFFEVWDAFMASPVENKVLALLIIVAPIVKTAYEVRGAWPDLKAGIVESSSRTRVKTKILKNGVPYLGVALGYVLIFSFTRSIIIGTLGAISLGITLRLAYSGVVRMKFGKSATSYDQPVSNAVLVQGYELDIIVEVDGKKREFKKYLAVVDGDHRYAADDVDTLTDEVIERAEEVGTSGDPTPSVYEFHAEDLIEYGIWKIEETRDKLIEQTRKSLMKLLRTGDGTADRDRLRKEMSDLPPRFVEDKISDYAESGVLSRDRRHVILERDPWRA